MSSALTHLRPTCRHALAAAACALALGLAAPAAEADGSVRAVKGSASILIEERSDGSKRIFNETSRQRGRRLASRLGAPRPELSVLIDAHARRHNLNPQLVQAVIQVESGYNPRARSHKGAMGLMQLMPATAKLLGVSDPYDPGQNIDGGSRYLRQQIDRFTNLSHALAAYNAGPTAVTRYGGIPPYQETRNYVRKVLSLLGLAASTPAPRSAQERARSEQRRREAAERLAAARGPAAPEGRTPGGRTLQGKKVYLRRGEDNRIFFTTVPPKKSR